MATCITYAGGALAHFPVSRGVAVAPGGAAAIALPGFGVAMRSSAGGPFSYVCDALLGVTPSDVPPAMAFAADGSLLVGSTSGLRSVDANGCPRADFGGELQNQPLAHLAVHAVRPNVVYAVTDATNATLPRVFRSNDGGTTWERRASLVALNPVTALVLDPSEPDVVYVSQAAPGGGGLLHVSKDAGASFSTMPQTAGLTLLDVEPAAGDAGSARLWAVGRSATAMGNQGFSLFGATSPSGPWSSVHDVRFFGGFARDDRGALWFGDEAGGVYRSTDGGGSFINLSPTTAVSCLDFAQGAVWACTPGIAQQTALVTWNDARQDFDGIVALASVTRLVECSAEADVATKCAAAWREWQRDILMLPQAPKDAGAPPSGTGGSPADASLPVMGRQANTSGCSIATHTASKVVTRPPSSSVCTFAIAALCLAASARRLRRAKSRLGVPPLPPASFRVSRFPACWSLSAHGPQERTNSRPGGLRRVRVRDGRRPGCSRPDAGRVRVTEEPVTAINYAAHPRLGNERGPVPRNGLSIHFNADGCGPSHGTSPHGSWNSVGYILTYRDYEQTIVSTESSGCFTTAWGSLNHVEISISKNHVDIAVSDASTDGGATFEALQKITGVDLDLPFTRGYVHITGHNHAVEKYCHPGSGFCSGTEQVAPVYHWDNVGFDGPVVSNFREYEIPWTNRRSRCSPRD